MKHNLVSLNAMRNSNQTITWLTCYDFSFATSLAATDLDMILVGDSGGMVALGYSDTLPVTMDEMIHFSSAVRRGAPNKFIVGDMPKGSYESSDLDAIRNAMRFVKESGCDAVKLEGGSKMASRVKAITDSGIPVIGHIGLTPQTSSAFGGYRVVGREKGEMNELQNSISDLEEAGVFAILLEAIPPILSKTLTKKSKSIILGIGAGKHTHGQLLILHDLLGLFPTFRPRFAKCFIPEVISKFTASLEQSDLITFGRTTRKDGLHELTRLAVEIFIQDVRAGKFPDTFYSYKD
jgi:3-methyl-2-oxobutanoate hydroxymethyltransferase